MIVILCSHFTFSLSCGTKLGTDAKSESPADVKKRIWQETSRDAADNLRTIREIKIKRSIGRPGSFLISADNNLYISDNKNGGLYKISPDFEVIAELGDNQLLYPTRIREAKDNLFVYDNNGINIFDKDGQLIRTVKSYLKIEDFDLEDEKSFIASLAEPKPDIDPNVVALIDSSGKRVGSMGKTHSFDYPEVEERAFVDIQDSEVYVCYKFDPLFEIYDLKSKALLQSFNIGASIFPRLIELKQDKKFINPEPGSYKIPKFVAGIRVVSKKIFVLLHTPNPQIVEFTQGGTEVGRYISSETEVLDYFGFDVRLTRDTKQFFVGTIDYSSKPSLVVYEDEL
ncbi:MAG: hypothetical protein ABL999_03490 [Pyrinomonadaceae bacterium]